MKRLTMDTKNVSPKKNNKNMMDSEKFDSIHATLVNKNKGVTENKKRKRLKLP